MGAQDKTASTGPLRSAVSPRRSSPRDGAKWQRSGQASGSVGAVSLGQSMGVRSGSRLPHLLCDRG